MAIFITALLLLLKYWQAPANFTIVKIKVCGDGFKMELKPFYLPRLWVP